MTALPPEVAADLERRVAELEQKLQAALAERNDSIAREAAIWAETARLYRELGTARDRQTASADILRTIGSVSGDAQTSLQQIAETTARLFGAPSVSIMLAENGEWTDTFRFGTSAELVRSAIPLATTRVGGRNLPGTVVVQNRQVHIPDLDHLDPAIADWPGPPLARAAGTRTMCGTPLRREGKAIGVLVVYRDRRAPFTDEELALQQSFADQAAIATENSRLFNETREALERQNASADILRTIASAPGDAERALYQIAETSARLFGAPSATIHIAEGDGWAKTIRVGDTSKRVGAGVPDSLLKIGGRNMPGTIVAENRQVHIPDVDNVDPAIADWPGLPFAREAGTRSLSGSPLRREGRAIGALIVYRDRLAPFTEEELVLQQSFADQAAIAIENARLFNETREALERQTATAEILKVIASSPSDVQPVFDAILDRALHLCEAAFGFLTIYDGEQFEFAAQRGVPAQLGQHFAAGMDQPLPGDAHWRLLAGEDLIHNLDQKDEEAYWAGNPLRRAVVDLGGARSALVVALRQSGSLRGAITIYRKEVRPFSQHQNAFLRHFPDQAVIAIENARLFNETREALERQTATAEIL